MISSRMYFFPALPEFLFFLLNMFCICMNVTFSCVDGYCCIHHLFVDVFVESAVLICFLCQTRKECHKFMNTQQCINYSFYVFLNT